MTDPMKAVRDMATLAAEGALRFGDDPKAIAAFIEAEIAKLPAAERTALQQGLQMIAHDPVGVTGRGCAAAYALKGKIGA